MKATLCVLACLLLPMVPVRAVDAQTFTGGIRGVITDANGVLPGATVTLTNEGTNVSRDTTTNDVGQYNFPRSHPATTQSRSSWRITRRSTGRDCVSARSSSSRWT